MIKIDFTTKPQPELITPKYISNYWGDKCLLNKNGIYHSYNDLPAIVCPNGSKLWYKHGLKHRNNDLPAVIWADGTKEYWVNGKRIK